MIISMMIFMMMTSLLHSPYIKSDDDFLDHDVLSNNPPYRSQVFRKLYDARAVDVLKQKSE